MRERPGVSARECREVEDQAGPRGLGTRDLGTVLLGCDLWPERSLPYTDSCSSPVSRPQGRYGAAPFCHRFRSCRGPSDPRPQTRNARTDPGPIHFRLPPPLPPPPPAPRPVPRARHSPGAPQAPCAGPHGTGSSRLSRGAFCRRNGKLTTTPRGQHGHSSGHISSQEDPGPRAEAAGPEGLGRPEWASRGDCTDGLAVGALASAIFYILCSRSP